MGNELEHVQRRDGGGAELGGEQLHTPGRATRADDGQQAGITVLQRVHAAAQANDFLRLAAIQQEMRDAMVANDPRNPPQEAREALATMRHWAMDRVADVRDRHAAALQTAAAAAATTSTPGAAATEAVEATMDTECTPYLDFLMQGDPQYRYEHFNQVIADKVFAAVQLHGARRGVAQIGNRAAAEAEARARGGLGAKDDWCGAFAFTQAEQAGGMDAEWRVHMQGEGGIRSALAYAGMANIWIWAFDHWEQLAAYHAQRGSQRWYEAIDRAPPSRGIRPGDTVLYDNSFGTNPDHITTAISFDGRWLTTVGGNQGAGERGVSRNNAFDITANPAPNDVRKIVNGERLREVDPDAGPKHVRVHGIGRWSIVDHERHIYRTSASRPTTPPSDAQLRALR